MAQIKITYFSMLREVTGRHEEGLEVGNTVRSALQKLFEKYGERLRKIIIKEQDIPHDSVIIALNGKSIKYLKGLDTILNDGDKLTFFFAAGGG
ncbi:MoaD/ThiS family protein [Candidatus Borrarchaeum sp.]|uniref:MoaD/ThiS family protein n=1 Tax=Candidatus Borrarchaeum sp. TaxID=2846742 RepID=UPI00257B10C0|nr:MoaD/ThiS family protein [Candidatus Borrarchaeum sp.]